MNKKTFSKIIFYILLFLNNISALGFIGISFLTGPSSGGEGALILTEAGIFGRHVVYATIVSLVFSGISFLIGFLFRKTIGFSHRALLYLPIAEFVFFVVAFLVVYLAVFFA